MSTKKTGADHTPAGEQRERQEDIRARIESGKAEIMKIVEGVPGSEKLSELIEKGKKKGNLSASEL